MYTAYVVGPDVDRHGQVSMYIFLKLAVCLECLHLPCLALIYTYMYMYMETCPHMFHMHSAVIRDKAEDTCLHPSPSLPPNLLSLHNIVVLQSQGALPKTLSVKDGRITYTLTVAGLEVSMNK